MKKILKDILLSGLGALVITKEKGEEIIDGMIRQGEITRQEGKQLLQDFLYKSEEGTQRLTNRVTEEVEKRLSKAGFVTRKELEEIRLQLNEIKEEIHQIKMKEEE